MFSVIRIVLVFFCLVHIGCAEKVKPSAEFVSPCQKPTEGIVDSILRIQNGENSTASGVVVGKNQVLTAAHVIDESLLTFIYVNGAWRQATIIESNTVLDLTLLAVDTESLIVIPVNVSPLDVSQVLWTVGFPLAMDQKVSLGYYEKMWHGRLYSSNHVNSGVSGGALLRCDKGNFTLAGVVHGYVAMNNGDSLINIGDATSVPSPDIVGFLKYLNFASTGHFRAAN